VLRFKLEGPVIGGPGLGEAWKGVEQGLGISALGPSSENKPVTPRPGRRTRSPVRRVWIHAEQGVQDEALTPPSSRRGSP
jgi:hypothetical protein